VTQERSTAVEVQCLADRIERLPGLLSVIQTRQLINISKSALYEKVHRGTVPYVYLDGTIRFDPIRLAAWLREREIVANNSQLPKAA
jgi:hypothetical protein